MWIDINDMRNPESGWNVWLAQLCSHFFYGRKPGHSHDCRNGTLRAHSTFTSPICATRNFMNEMKWNAQKSRERERTLECAYKTLAARHQLFDSIRTSIQSKWFNFSFLAFIWKVSACLCAARCGSKHTTRFHLATQSQSLHSVPNLSASLALHSNERQKKGNFLLPRSLCTFLFHFQRIRIAFSVNQKSAKLSRDDVLARERSTFLRRQISYFSKTSKRHLPVFDTTKKNRNVCSNNAAWQWELHGTKFIDTVKHKKTYFLTRLSSNNVNGCKQKYAQARSERNATKNEEFRKLYAPWS